MMLTHQLLVGLSLSNLNWGDIFPYFLFLLLCVPAIGYYCYGIYAAIAFFSRPTPIDPDFYPPVTILKPICGLDNDTYENFASFCQQDYPEYEIIFGVRDSQDPCIEVVQAIMRDFPTVAIQLVVRDRVIGSNLKVSNLFNAVAKAKYDLLVLADSDVRVDPSYLRQIIQPMSDPQVGVVTCLYRPLTRGWVANFEAVGISTEYLASVLVANQLEGMSFALGPTVAIRRTVLEKIGGFEAIADYLADDFQLGYLPTQAGYKVVLSDYVIDHVISTDSFTDLIRRQIRWACCTRVSRPGGYVGLIFTYGTATSLGFLLATHGSGFGWVGLGLTWFTRLLMAWVIGVMKLRDTTAKRFLWIVPLRDLISFGIWCYCFASNTIQWRGQQMRLTKAGKLVPLTVKPVKIFNSSVRLK
ncbi:MAG: bacteriohopanetetrol glucosamine biosynthesis glycosyltransferase HpnI [Leptolyngbyaceae bacterium]|nr:bacteriohopanetetrol glucosamine biosynthesis glycosyltransferase HpnI [Leptolyngbyaceae bacterium]